MEKTHDLLINEVAPRIGLLRVIGFDLLRNENMSETNIKLLTCNYRENLRILLDKFQQTFSDNLNELTAIANIAQAVKSKTDEMEHANGLDETEILIKRVECFAWLEAMKNVLEIKLLHASVY